MISKNALKIFSVVFCCKVGVNYGLYSEITHQSRCGEKKKVLLLQFVTTVLEATLEAARQKTHAVP